MNPKEIDIKIKALEKELNIAERNIREIRIRIRKEISDIKNLCPHEHTEKVHSSSGTYWQQSINCLDCEQILLVGQHLFDPKKANRSYSGGN